jgi:predicted RNA-binding Zn-ribbon protein involved in translation (DUF1610 family)
VPQAGTIDSAHEEKSFIQAVALTATDGQDKDTPEVMEAPTVKCGTCAATFTIEPNVTSDRCPFCGEPVVIGAAQAERLIKPQGLLPFSVTDKDAHLKFRNWIKGLWWAPGKLKKQAFSNNALTGTYVPYWTYDAETLSRYTGRRGIDREVTSTDSDGETTTTTETRWHDVSGTMQCCFDDLLVVASDSLPKDEMDELAPWDLENLTPYADEYLSGFKAERYSVDVQAGFERAKEIMDGEIRDHVELDIGGDRQEINSLSTDYDDVSYKHVLLPIWLSAYSFQGTTYRFVINGRTGEVQGERPISAVKVILALLAGFLVAGGVVLWAYTRGG